MLALVQDIAHQIQVLVLIMCFRNHFHDFEIGKEWLRDEKRTKKKRRVERVAESATDALLP